MLNADSIILEREWLASAPFSDSHLPSAFSEERETAMDHHHHHRPNFPNPPNDRFPPFFPPSNSHHNRLPPPPPLVPHHSPVSRPPPPPPPNSFNYGHRDRIHQPPHPAADHRAPPHSISQRNSGHSLRYGPADFPQSPRVADRFIYDDDRHGRSRPPSRGFDDDPYHPAGGPPVWEPRPRVPVDAPPPPVPRRNPRAGYDRGPSPYRPFEVERLPLNFQPVDRFRDDLDGGPRIRKESNADSWFRVDEFSRERRDGPSRNDNFHRDRLQRGFDRDVSPNEFALDSNNVERFSRLIPEEDLIRNRRGSMVNENPRRSYLPRGAPHSPVEMRSGPIDSGSGYSEFYDKGKNHVLESQRYGDRDRCQEAQDSNLTPRKKMKKNVFLRMQPGKPIIRNTPEYSSGVCEDRESFPVLDNRFINERERSPVVSFKSNLLIVASNSGDVACGGSAFSDGKDRNEVIANLDDSNQQCEVVEGIPLNTSSYSHGENYPCTVNKKEIHMEKKNKLSTNLKKANPSDGGDLRVRISEAPPCKAEYPSREVKHSKAPKGKVLDGSYSAAGSGKESSPSSRKKRKATNSHPSASGSEVLKRDSTLVGVNKMVNNSSYDSRSDKIVEHSRHDLPCGAQISDFIANAALSHMKSTIIASPKGADGKVADGPVSAGASITKVKRRKIINPRPCSSKQMTGKPDAIPVIGVQSVRGDHTTLNSDGMINRFQKRTSSDVSINDGNSMFVDIDPVPLERCDEAASSVKGADSSSSPEFVSSVERKKINLIQEPCEDQTVSLEDGEIVEPLEAGFLEEHDKSTKTSSSGKLHNPEIPDASCCKAIISDAADSIVTGSSELLVSTSDACAGNGISELSCRLPTPHEFGPSRELCEVLRGDVCVLSGEVFVSHNGRKRQGSELYRDTDKTNDCFIDSDPVQDKVIVPGCTSAGVPVESPTTNDLSMNDCVATSSSRGTSVSAGKSGYANPTEVATSACNVKNRVPLPPVGSAHRTPNEVFDKPADSDAPPCDAEVPSHPISAEEVRMSVLKSSSQSELDETSKGLDFGYCNNAVHQVSSSLKSVEKACGEGSSCSVLLDADYSLGVSVPVVPDEEQNTSLSESTNLLTGDETLLITGGGACSVGARIESRNEKLTPNQIAGSACSPQNQSTDQAGHCLKPPVVNADYEPLARDLEYNKDDSVKDDLPSESGCIPLSTQSTSHGRVMKSALMADNARLVDPPVNLLSSTTSKVSNVPDLNRMPDQNLAEQKSKGKSLIEAGSPALSLSSSTLKDRANVRITSATDGNAISSGKILPLLPLSRDAKLPISGNKKTAKTGPRSATDGNAISSGKIMPLLPLSRDAKLPSTDIEKTAKTGPRAELALASAKALSSRSPLVASSSGRGPANVVKSRTWQRADNPSSERPGQNSAAKFVPRQKPTYNQTMRVQGNSYVRKGNSLLRNPTPSISQGTSSLASSTSVPQLNPSSSDGLKHPPSEKPQKLPSPPNIGLSVHGVAPLGDSRYPPLSDASITMENGSHRSPEDVPNSSRTSEFEISKTSEDQATLNHQSIQAASSARRMVYIKHKSNQLVAASNSTDSSSSKDRQSSMSDVYVKKKKNQLVRAASPQTTELDDSSSSEGQRVFKSHISSGTAKRGSNIVSRKIPKLQRLSLVWTLRNVRSPKKGAKSVKCQQVLPHLLPWKRATYRRSFSRTSANFVEKSPLKMLSHKMLSSRKRDIIYTRSGFSLRRSKVVSLAGFNLKWSKSLERRSKKVDKMYYVVEQQVTSAVVASEKDKRENGTASDAIPGIASKNDSTCGRIYQIGMFRYKMDPSGRTLQRIPDEEPSSSETAPQEKKALKPPIPRRLLIGNDEYVRIGNGNQLIRNPKRRTRILANEKVRWSLHTARKRLAKKRKYCLFFTRFGKCNKDEGKCPYIHDLSKVAVCTKFLNGLCADPQCKLTHKVIPERMPDCSFFLQGLCSNENCPYRHVNVNPKADVCGSFLKGYCADGNECQKKHSYMCPVFEATGECPKGQKCKLYHRKKGKDKKRKITKDRRSDWGRYFAPSPTTGNDDMEIEGSAKRCMLKKGEEMIFEDASLADFISLGASEEEEEDEDGEETDEASQQADSVSEGELPNLFFGDLDEQIKPVRLLGGKSFRVTSQASGSEGCSVNEESPLCETRVG